jgi:hypothetical protein
MGLPLSGWRSEAVRLLFSLPTRRFAHLAAFEEPLVAEKGLAYAARMLLERLGIRHETRGQEHIPTSGPLIVASNHPGAVDIAVITAQMPRDDIRLIISDVPFTRILKNTSNYFIYSTGQNLQARVSALRAALRHLQQDGALLIFPTGVVDPDPSFMPGAEEALQDWSASLELLLGKAPATNLLPVITSGVLVPKFLNNPLARRQPTRRQRQKVAEYLEMMQLMVLQKNPGLHPRISYGTPLDSAALRDAAGGASLSSAIQAEARSLLNDHMESFYPIKYR